MEKINTKNAPAAVGPYSQAVIYNGLVYTSGQIALVPETGAMAEGCVKCQTRQVMKNLQAVLYASHSKMANILKTTCFLADIADFAAFNEVYAEYIQHKPARSCVAVKDLPKGALVEVEVIAALSEETD